MRDGKFSGLTKRNEDYLFHLDKALTEKNYDREQKEQVLTEMYQELKEKQKQGVVATKLYGTVTEKAELIVNGPKKSEAPTELPKFWILALDNGLIMFIMFCIMYTLLGVFSPKQADVSGGWITLLATSTIAGVGLAFFYRSMLSARKEKGKKRWIKTILITLELILIWIVAFGVIAFIPVSINRTMEPIVYAILAGLGYLVRRYLKKKYNFRSVMF